MNGGERGVAWSTVQLSLPRVPGGQVQCTRAIYAGLSQHAPIKAVLLPREPPALLARHRPSHAPHLALSKAPAWA